MTNEQKKSFIAHLATAVAKDTECLPTESPALVKLRELKSIAENRLERLTEQKRGISAMVDETEFYYKLLCEALGEAESQEEQVKAPAPEQLPEERWTFVFDSERKFYDSPIITLDQVRTYLPKNKSHWMIFANEEGKPTDFRFDQGHFTAHLDGTPLRFYSMDPANFVGDLPISLPSRFISPQPYWPFRIGDRLINWTNCEISPHDVRNAIKGSHAPGEDDVLYFNGFGAGDVLVKMGSPIYLNRNRPIHFVFHNKSNFINRIPPDLYEPSESSERFPIAPIPSPTATTI